MPRVHREALLPWSAEQMFALVNDVEAYPQFLPGCVGAEVLQRQDAGMRARLTLNKAGVRQAFTTENRWQAPQRLSMQLVDGPFTHLRGEWTFTPLGSGCKAVLDVDFAFSNKLVGLAFGPVFEKLLLSLMDAFQARAKQIHGLPR